MFQYSTEGEDFNTIALRVRASGEGLKAALVNALNNAAEAAGLSLHANAPRKSGKLAQSVKITPAYYAPGAPGGGGFYEAKVTVGEDLDYTGYLIEGTGLHGPTGQLIRPSSGNIMHFIKNGENVFTQWTRGQKGQDDWVEFSQRDADVRIREELARIDMSQL